jgi:hypothetical protein
MKTEDIFFNSHGLQFVKGYVLKILILLMILIVPGKISAQFSIYAFPPPPAFSIDDLWNLNIMLNGTSQFEEYFITLELFENKLGKVAETRTRQFILKSNLMTINKSNYESYIDKESTNYLNTEFYNSCSQAGGRIPPGTYMAHYTFWGVIVDPILGKVIENLLTYDLDIAEYDVYPPSLIQVYDRDTISDLMPVFSWTPPFPSPAGQIIQYRIRFTEQMKGQIAEEAMLSNPAVLELEQNQSTVLHYPAYAFYLADGSTYAWQVSAYAGEVLLGRSEVWSFSIQTPELHNEQITTKDIKDCRAVMTIHPDQGYSSFKEKKISFSFPDNTLVDNAFTCRLYDSDKRIVRLKNEKLSKNGAGLYEIETDNLGSGMYLLEAKMEKNSFYLRFKIDSSK